MSSSNNNNLQRANQQSPDPNRPMVSMLSLYSESCLALLEQALARALSTYQQNQQQNYFNNYYYYYSASGQTKSSSSSDNEDDDDEVEKDQSSSSEEDSSTGDGAMDQLAQTLDSKLSTTTQNDALTKNPKTKQMSTNVSSKVDPRQVQRHLDFMPRLGLEISEFESLEISSSLLQKTDVRSDPVRQCQAYIEMVRSIVGVDTNNQTQPSPRPVIILCLRSGKFAGGVFIRDDKHDPKMNNNNSYILQHPVLCIDHRTLARYTVRKKQGKAQSSQDASGRRPLSMGAQLRRHGEMQLQQDIRTSLREWRHHFQNAALIWISVPKTMQPTLFGSSSDQGKPNPDEFILRRDDPRIRKVPLDVGRPTFETLCLIHTVLMTATIRENHPTPLTSSSNVDMDNQDREKRSQDANLKLDSNTDSKQQDVPKSSVIVVPLSPLHQAVVDGDLEQIRAIILQLQQQQEDNEDVDNNIKDGINSTAGEMGMTPLHYAAAAAFNNHDNNQILDPVTTAAECVRILLEVGRADPCRGDARRRVPYYLANHEKIRDAFRIARAHLGEDYCAWDEQAKVGPPLTPQDLELRKEKDAEKKRKKRARLKEKKAKEKAEEKRNEELRLAEEKRKQDEEDAKRVRDGLQPKMGGGGVCDFCQKQCKGKQRAQMFKRLSYSYCSTGCVQNHKRELMAAAATARFHGTG